MRLPGTYLFPGGLLPLFIFEPRYREMLEHSLAGPRAFCVDPSSGEEPEAGAIGGFGIVRACVRNSDGTSSLILQGVSRVRFVEWLACNEYPSAHIELVPESPARSPRCEQLLTEVRASIDLLRKAGLEIPESLDSMLRSELSPAVFSNLAAAALFHEPAVRGVLFRETSAEKRLALIKQVLEELAGN